MKTINKITLLALIILWIPFNIFAQPDSISTKNDWGKYIFLPAIEMGYLHNNAASLSGGLLIKTSLEYRIKTNQAPFLRLNYDTYEARYNLKKPNDFTNILEGNVSFSNLLLGVGYRFGSPKIRFLVLAQSGIKLYDYPNTILNKDEVVIEQKSQLEALSRITVGIEYYITPKSAFSIDVLYNQTWSKDYFWKDQGGAVGISIGFITALF